MTAPGLGDAACGRRSGVGHLARRAGEAAATAQVGSRGAAETEPAVRRLQRRRRRQDAAPADVARADLRAGRARHGFLGRRARTCSPPAFAPAISCTMRSPITLRPAPTSWNPALDAIGCAVIPGGIGNTEQQLEAIAQSQPTRLYRHAGFPEDSARYGREIRQGRVVAQARPRVRRGVAAVAARRSSTRAASRCCSAMRTADVGVIAYESARARRHDRQRDDDRRDRAARHRRSGRRRRCRRGRRHRVQSPIIR